MRAEATIVSMTDMYGKTGNIDYKDCRMPTDSDLVSAAEKYGLTEGIKFTITSVVGAKTKFTADIVGKELVRRTAVEYNLNELKRMCVAVMDQELAKILKYQDLPHTAALMEELGIREEEIWSIVNKKREGLWFCIPDRYKDAMFNCALAEYVTDLMKQYDI